MSPVIEKYQDSAALVAAAGDRLVDAITDAIDKRGHQAKLGIGKCGGWGRLGNGGGSARREGQKPG